jgi:prepilin-type N-terminal cleavage/methylation domain-containing protein
MRNNKKAFTLVEMLVAMAVSAVIIAATYASYQLVQQQFKKNADVTELHSSGRAIVQLLEREIRMAGYEFRDNKGLMTYGAISSPIIITDSGNKCCDEVTIIYDEVEDTVNAQGVVTSSTVERIKVRFFTRAHSSSNKGSRFRLYRQETVLGRNNAIVSNPSPGGAQIMADYVEDFQLNNTSGFANLYASDGSKLHVYDTISLKFLRTINLGSANASGGSIAIGSDGLVYSSVRNGAIWNQIRIINPKTDSITSMASPGGANRWASGVGMGPDGYLYINTTGAEVDVYDMKTKALIRTITPNQQVKDLLDVMVSTSSNGVRCQARAADPGIFCSSQAIFLTSAKNTLYKTIQFGSGDILYAASGANGADIDVYNTTSKTLVGTITGGGGRQSYGLVAASSIKTLSTVNLTLGLRSKNPYGKARKYKKKTYLDGNFNFDVTDSFKHDTFSSTISVRNL